MKVTERSVPLPSRRWFLVAGFLLILLTGLGATRGEADEAGFQPVEGLYEPSGVAQLMGGEIVAVEDESARPFSLLSIDGDALSLEASPLRSRSLLDAINIDFSDLEGVAVDGEGFVYAITSHSRKSSGKRAPERELMMRFRVENKRLVDLQVVSGLRKALADAFPKFAEAAEERNVKRDGGLNIEGLAFDRRTGTLWVGFRGPLEGERAILVAIVNPGRVFEVGEPIRFDTETVRLDLDGGGIRGLSYDSRLGGYLILSQREGTKKEKPFKLWLWHGDRDQVALRVRIDGAEDLRRAEAVTPIRLNGKEKILLLSDDGNYGRRRPAGFLLVDYAALRVDEDSATR